jgi:hypothetical protein
MQQRDILAYVLPTFLRWIQADAHDRRHSFIAICLLLSALCLLNANDLKVQNATWSADGYLVASPVTQQGLTHG